MTGTLHWRDTSSLGRTNQEDEERELPFMREQLVCMEFCLDMADESMIA